MVVFDSVIVLTLFPPPINQTVDAITIASIINRIKQTKYNRCFRVVRLEQSDIKL
jgi:hypothetical protein